MRADVQGLMGGQLGSWLEGQSHMREEAREKANNRWFYGGLAAIPVLAFLWVSGFFGFTSNIMISAVLIGMVYSWGHQPIAEAKKTVKVGINAAIAENLGVNYEHEVTPGEEFEACRTYGLVPDYDREEFEDHWYGELEGHGFQLYEAHLEEKRGSGRHQRWVTVFQGAIICMQFGRPFRSTTLLQRSGKHKKFFGLGGRKDHVKFQGHRLDYVDQVHPQFEDVFDLWSDDQVEARVIAHPSYIEHLIAIENAFDGEDLRALFTRESVVIAIESGDLFESGSMDAYDDEARVEEAAEQFAALARLALAINQTERGRIMGMPTVGGAADIAPPLPGNTVQEIGAGDRRRVRRQAGGFGRKGL